MDENKSENGVWKPDWDWYRTHIKQVWEDIQSSTDNFDKSMLTLSSGALGVSLVFIKDIVPLGQAVWVNLLLLSWIAFAICLLITVASFQVSIAAQKAHAVALYKFGVEGKPEFFNRETFPAKLLRCCTYATSFFFVVGLACTMIFVCKNVRNVYMHNDTKGGKPIETAFLQEGRLPMAMMPIPAPVPPATTTTAPQSGTTTNAGSTVPAAPCPPKE